jgi:L-lactate dehydrogenase complex protein LldG
MAKREEMLNAIRNALKKQGDPGLAGSGGGLPASLENVMPPIPVEGLMDRFEAELQALGCKSYRASSPTELESLIRSIIESAQAGAVVLSGNPLLVQLRIAESLQRWGKKVKVWQNPMAAEFQEPEGLRFREDCFQADIGITGADYALAESGSFVLTSSTEGSQLASLAPPVHLVLYRRSQIRASLDEVLLNLPVSRGRDRPSPARSVVFVTGPSRTADIEQILVRGVHGPGEVHAILVEESCLAG